MRPIFALEHGLSPEEIALIQDGIRREIKSRRTPRDYWLPFIIYCVEIGYSYVGDEYWQTFEKATPGWREYGDRHIVRDLFKRFRTTFDGAAPLGPWAEHFSIIAWPLTHAVLPRDLQRQLARVLFDYRLNLTQKELRNPALLGQQLAARAGHTNSRFRIFAQNVGLLGHVSAALYEDPGIAPGPLLLPSTLDRIVADISQERQAKSWLSDARGRAQRVRRKGFLIAERPRGLGRNKPDKSAPRRILPQLTLIGTEKGWQPHLEVPDLSPISEYIPDLRQHLESHRCRVNGLGGAPLARGKLLRVGQRIGLTAWPDSSKPLLQLEGGPQSTNQILAEMCATGRGPWLFKICDRGVAVEVRSKNLRTGTCYVLVVNRTTIPSDLPTWVQPASLVIDGAHAFYLKCPDSFSESDLSMMNGLNVVAAPDLQVRPVGLLPAAWDGEGHMVWNLGEDPTIALSCGRSPTSATLKLNGKHTALQWPLDHRELMVGFDSLDEGIHDVGITIFGEEARVINAGSLQIDIRALHAGHPGGDLRYGLQLLASPNRPTLSELWNGTATIEVLGPSGSPTEISLLLYSRDKANPLTTGTITTDLPISAIHWEHIFNRLKQDANTEQFYDVSESCEIKITHPAVGHVSLDCDREFAALRWVMLTSEVGSIARLIDHTDVATTKVSTYSSSRPDIEVPIELTADGDTQLQTGGLVFAQSEELEAGIVVPPTVHDLDGLKLALARPQLRPRGRSPYSVIALVHLAAQWTGAALPAGILAATQRRNVLREITASIAGLIGGPKWSAIERQLDPERLPSAAALVRAASNKPYQSNLAHEVWAATKDAAQLPAEERGPLFLNHLQKYIDKTHLGNTPLELADGLLRLASGPGSALFIYSTDKLARIFDLTFSTPVLIRVARILVWGIHYQFGVDTNSTYQGWQWQ